MSKKKPFHLDQPSYWFAVLETAREQDDTEGAEEAERELKRLGVSVSYIWRCCFVAHIIYPDQLPSDVGELPPTA